MVSPTLLTLADAFCICLHNLLDGAGLLLSRNAVGMALLVSICVFW